jgi:hypothetical protein
MHGNIQKKQGCHDIPENRIIYFQKKMPTNRPLGSGTLAFTTPKLNETKANYIFIDNR